MMSSLSEAEEEQFFDTRDEITSVSDSGSDFSECCLSGSGLPNCVFNGFGFEFWRKTPESAHRRRSRFLKWMDLSLDQKQIEKVELEDALHDEIRTKIGRIKQDGGAAIRLSILEDPTFSCQSEAEEAAELLREDASSDNFKFKGKNLDDGTEFIVDKVGNDGTLSRLREFSSNRSVTIEEFQRTFGSSSLVQQLMCKKAESDNLVDTKNKIKSSWFRKLRIKSRTVSQKDKVNLNSVGPRFQRVGVHPHGKRWKELSSLCIGQELLAHEGSILTMKFSPDGEYLASAGEDGIVRVWKVMEVERTDKADNHDIDPSCLYFSVNNLSKPSSSDVNKEKIGKMKKLKNSTELSGVLLPPKVFQVKKEPVHEFCGHSGEVLALSWSKSGLLLSSSVDKTVCLWQVGCNQCLQVFSHNNYVTCVEFNPVDENYFISGSIDGKVRIWEVDTCRVTDWIEVREIVTAVCYYPSGKGGVVGLMDGRCCFYDIIDNRLQLDYQICLEGKKKLPCKRITGFQFSPCDTSKVLVTSADCQIRLLCGVNVILKFKGPQVSGTQVTASFTADGKHIVSASEDSHVCVWEYVSPPDKNLSRAKSTRCCENFFSHNALIAIPWCGTRSLSGSLTNPSQDLLKDVPPPSPDSSSMTCKRLLESLPRGSATWPEEKLSRSSLIVASPSTSRSEHKCLKDVFQDAYTCHMWGLVIVTGGWDGQIRTYHNYGFPIRL
ncbi:hypothetical protein NMG60_11030595 [Bertholletia excelsa]